MEKKKEKKNHNMWDIHFLYYQEIKILNTLVLKLLSNKHMINFSKGKSVSSTSNISLEAYNKSQDCAFFFFHFKKLPNYQIGIVIILTKLVIVIASTNI